MNIPTYKSVIPGIEVVMLGAPLFAQVELTEVCQYRCQFCYNVWKDRFPRNKPRRLSRKQALLVMDKLIDCRIFSIIFSGGEPTTCAYLPEVVAKAALNGISASIITNGAKLTVGLLTELKEAGLESFQISMHHFDPKSMDQITRHRGSFRKTIAGIDNALCVFGPELFNVNMVAMSHTVDDVYAMGSFLQSIGVTHFSVGVVSYCGEAAMNQLSVGKSGFLKVYGQLKQLHQNFGMSVSLTGGLPMCIVPEYGADEEVQVANICDAGINQIVVGPDGNMRPCVQHPTVVGNALTDDIPSIWKSSTDLLSIRRFENVPSSCYTCPVVSGCHGGCRAAALRYTNNVVGLDPMMTEA